MRRPERRNRKSGTKDFGWRAQNKMKVPQPYRDRYGNFSSNVERLESSIVRKVTIQGHEMTVIYEEPRYDAAYPCSIEDVLHILSLVPEHDLEDLDIIAFRQPTRNQQKLEAVWGRLYYYAEFYEASGSAMILEAMDVSQTIKRPRRMSVEMSAELDRLQIDGHHIEKTSRDFLIHTTPETSRNTVLYRTVLHELGHWVDYMEKTVWVASMIGKDGDSSEELYFSRPTREREDFAHRYADEMGAKLREQGLIPFDPR